MQYQKLDASLAAALGDPSADPKARYSVFVRLRRPMDEESVKRLRALGLRGDIGHLGVVTARLSLSAVAAVSDEESVIAVRGSQMLEPLS